MVGMRDGRGEGTMRVAITRKPFVEQYIDKLPLSMRDRFRRALFEAARADVAGEPDAAGRVSVAARILREAFVKAEPGAQSSR
jgi:hypothetical protein